MLKRETKSTVPTVEKSITPSEVWLQLTPEQKLEVVYRLAHMAYKFINAQIATSGKGEPHAQKGSDTSTPS